MRRIRSELAIAAAAAALVGGCGGGSGGGGSSSTAAAGNTAAPGPTITATTPAPTAPPSTTTTPAKPPPSTSTVPQEAPGEGNGNAGGGGSGGGGGGGTEPARTELTFTATSGGVSPRQAGVAPFIAVKVTLVSKDGSSHTLTIGGQTARVGGSRKSASFTLAGLRAGRSYVGAADGKTTIRILSTSEPGP